MSVSKSKSLEIRTSLRSEISGRLSGWLNWILCSTLDYKVDNLSGVNPFQQPAIYLIWHNRVLCAPFVWHIAIRQPGLLSVLTSASKDGTILARAVSAFGLGAVRGSSSRRSVTALMQMKRLLDRGVSICISPDGPRGPMYSFNPSPLRLASLSGYPIIPVSINIPDCWRLRKSWDKFCIPKPFSHIDLCFHPAIPIPKGVDSDEDLQPWINRIVSTLKSGSPDFNK